MNGVGKRSAFLPFSGCDTEPPFVGMTKNMTPYTPSGRILVTSGPTRAWIDRVRYIANASTGALGAAIVRRLADRGYRVLHIAGRGAVLPEVTDAGIVDTRIIETVGDLVAAVREAADSRDIRAIVHAMAVLDYEPERTMDSKRPSDTLSWDIHLVRTPKVTAIMRELMPDARFIGFKLEKGVSGEELVRRAFASLSAHSLDLVIANDLDTVGPERHEALFVDRSGAVIAREATKQGIAERVVSIMSDHFQL